MSHPPPSPAVLENQREINLASTVPVKHTTLRLNVERRNAAPPSCACLEKRGRCLENIAG